MHNLEYPKDFFDVIVCGWTIAYSAEPNSAFQEFQRVLKPGGKLILTWDLPENFVINDSTRLTLSRKTDIDDSSTILPEENILIKVSTYFSIQRIEIGKLTFNSDTPFAMLALVKI
jgi:ubiquinone/menaquinone biosynthesis C-methylase UbiE